MVVQHGLGASDYSPVAGLPRKSNRIKASQASKVSATAQCPKCTAGYPASPRWTITP